MRWWLIINKVSYQILPIYTIYYGYIKAPDVWDSFKLSSLENNWTL